MPELTPFDELQQRVLKGDTDRKLFEAMWKKSELLDVDPGLGYVPRSRAEAALLLPDAVVEACPGDDTSFELLPQVHGWICELLGQAERGSTWLDALCAALLAALKAKEVANA